MVVYTNGGRHAHAIRILSEKIMGGSNPDEEYKKLMAAFDSPEPDEADKVVNEIADEIREKREKQKRKGVDGTIIEG